MDITSQNNIKTSSVEIKDRHIKIDRRLFFLLVFAGPAIAYMLGVATSLSKVNAYFRAQTGEVVGETQNTSEIEAAVFPTRGIEVKARWGAVLPELVAKGVIDMNKFTTMFEQSGEPLSEAYKTILAAPQDGLPIVFSSETARFTVDALWALGLAQESDVLLKGPMSEDKSSTGRFASTGGWTLGKSENAMDYYAKWNLLGLSSEDQVRVTRIAESVYRSCCGNSTAFPDCNHGMAMLGLIELMVSQDASDEDIYDAAKAANTYWFPDSTLEMAMYLQQKGLEWKDAEANVVVGKDYASGEAARRIHQELQDSGVLPQPKGGGSCGA